MMIWSNREWLILLTGSPSTWKNTILEWFLRICNSNKIRINRLITDTTRPKRAWEIDWYDYNFIQLDQYKQNFANWLYFWDDWSNSYNWNYYWTPRKWINTEWLSIWIPTCVSVTKEIIAVFDKKCVVWIHLLLEQQEKIKRLLERNISEEELNIRINRWDTHNIEKWASLNINTWSLRIDETISEVSNSIFEILR